MSLKSWKEEFYPIAASEVAREQAVQHSLQKWIGLRPENLKLHGVELQTSSFPPTLTSAHDSDALQIFSKSCALCKYYAQNDGCEGCPLQVANDETMCDATRGESPWFDFVEREDPERMISLLEKALREQ